MNLKNLLSKIPEVTGLKCIAAVNLIYATISTIIKSSSHININYVYSSKQKSLKDFTRIVNPAVWKLTSAINYKTRVLVINHDGIQKN